MNRTDARLSLAVAWIAAAPLLQAQSVLGGNLIANPGAELGPASTSLSTPVTSIPNWTTTTGKPNVLSYGLTNLLSVAEPSAQAPGFQYFVGGPSNLGLTSTLTQTIDVSSTASTIGTGTVKYTLSAYLGSENGSGLKAPAQLSAAFENANGQIFNTAILGPLGLNGNGMSMQQQIGLLPSGTMKIAVTLTLTTGCENAAACSEGAADNLSLVLTQFGTSPGTVLGTNLVANPGAEAGPGVRGATVVYIPGWSSSNAASVATYGGTNWIQTTDPGPPLRGVNFFVGGDAGAEIYQDLDVTPAAALIDAGQVTFDISAWLGSIAGGVSPTLTYTFYDWTNKQLATTAQLGPPAHTGTGLVETASNNQPLPLQTRRVHIDITFPSVNSWADEINFVLSGPGGAPVITPAGVVSAGAFGGFTTVAPGSWIEIYGTNLASAVQNWAATDFVNGVGPTSLGGVTVTIGGQAAFLDYVSPGQIDALVPSNLSAGATSLKVTYNNQTSDAFGIVVNPTQPGLLAPSSFIVGGKQYLAALFTDGTFALPANAIPGVASRPAKAGDTLIIYGVGFGPVTGALPAGTIVTLSNSVTSPVQFLFNTTAVTPAYGGLAPSFTGLYQFNVVVPTVTTNSALPISFTQGGAKGTQTLYIAVGN